MINKDLKVGVLGAGAMGCLFGGLLAEKGLNVTSVSYTHLTLPTNREV